VSQPIACKLTADQAAQRAEETAAIAERALRRREPIADGQRLRFEGGGELEARLRELIAAEAECCPFMQMSLRRAGDEVELDITGPDEAQPIIDALFARRPSSGLSAAPEGGSATPR
jgi:MerR family transcriptional regulator, copper efflux regulator